MIPILVVVASMNVQYCFVSCFGVSGWQSQGLEGVYGAVSQALRERAYAGCHLSGFRERRVSVALCLDGPDGAYTWPQVWQNAQGVQGMEGRNQGKLPHVPMFCSDNLGGVAVELLIWQTLCSALAVETVFFMYARDLRAKVVCFRARQSRKEWRVDGIGHDALTVHQVHYISRYDILYRMYLDVTVVGRPRDIRPTLTRRCTWLTGLRW